MPIYNYKCVDCNNEIEVIQKISDNKLTHCNICNKETLEKVLTSATFGFKGTGYYCTDFKNK